MKLYKHQIADIRRFKDESEIAIFGEMGTGKTCTALKIAQYKYQSGQIDSLLVIAPNDVHKQWATEQIPQWLTCKYRVQCLYGRGGAKQAFPFHEDDGLKIVCVNVDTFSTQAKWKEIIQWALLGKTMIILDEATSIKNPESSLRAQRIIYGFDKVVRKYRTVQSATPLTVARIILTGTPATNGPSDLWALMEFLKPNYFGRNYHSFKFHFGMFTKLTVTDSLGRDRTVSVKLNAATWKAIKDIKDFAEASYVFGISKDVFDVIHSQDHYEGPYKNADELKRLIEPVSVTRRLVDCVDMPEKNYITKRITPNKEILQATGQMIEKLIVQYKDVQMTAKNKISVILRLQQISAGFIIEDFAEDVQEREVRWLGKPTKLEALYRDVAECAKPLLILTFFSAEAEKIYEDLKDTYSCCLMTGWRKVGTIQGFKEGEYDIMIANLRLISKGFNLQNACTILYYSNTFSLEDRLQSEGRIFRIGQKNTCTYINYVYEGIAIDEKMRLALEQKKDLLDYIMGVEDLCQ